MFVYICVCVYLCNRFSYIERLYKLVILRYIYIYIYIYIYLSVYIYKHKFTYIYMCMYV